MNRIAIIGNGGGGKSALSRRLSSRLALPVLHLDSIQFLAGLQRRPEKETRTFLDEWSARDRWIIEMASVL